MEMRDGNDASLLQCKKERRSPYRDIDNIARRRYLHSSAKLRALEENKRDWHARTAIRFGWVRDMQRDIARFCVSGIGSAITK